MTPAERAYLDDVSKKFGRRLRDTLLRLPSDNILHFLRYNSVAPSQPLNDEQQLCHQIGTATATLNWQTDGISTARSTENDESPCWYPDSLQHLGGLAANLAPHGVPQTVLWSDGNDGDSALNEPMSTDDVLKAGIDNCLPYDRVVERIWQRALTQPDDGQWDSVDARYATLNALGVEIRTALLRLGQLRDAYACSFYGEGIIPTRVDYREREVWQRFNAMVTDFVTAVGFPPFVYCTPSGDPVDLFLYQFRATTA